MIELNGQPFTSGPGQTLSKLLEELGFPGESSGIAIAVDAEVIPRREWPQFIVHDGAKLELVRAAQGG